MSKLIKRSLVAASALLALQAQAGAITDASATATQGGNTNTNAETNQTEQANAWANGAGGGSAVANGFANQYFVYRTSASGYGSTGASNSSVRLRTTITNNTGTAQLVTGSFTIYGGNISTLIAAGYEALGTGEYLTAGYSAQLLVNGASKFASAASLAIGAGESTPVFTGSGTALSGDDTSDGIYSWSTQNSGALDLGVLGAGESLTIEALLSSFETHNVGAYQGEGGLECGYGSMAFGFGGCAGVTYGDPFVGGPFVGEGDPGFSFSFVPVAGDVPEPGAFALAGLALVAAGFSRRQRRQ